jgi:RNA polymerase sigma factor (TIGR02999 family)
MGRIDFTRRPPLISNISRVLSAIEHGDPAAAGQLLPLVYEELRKLAAQKLAREPSELTLQPTALVHEAYIRLIGVGQPEGWDGRGHFFAAAAEAIRRIPVEAARRRKAQKRGGGPGRADLDEALLAGGRSPDELLELDDLLERLAATNPEAAEVVKLRFFAGMTGDRRPQPWVSRPAPWTRCGPTPAPGSSSGCTPTAAEVGGPEFLWNSVRSPPGEFALGGREVRGDSP